MTVAFLMLDTIEPVACSGYEAVRALAKNELAFLCRCSKRCCDCYTRIVFLTSRSSGFGAALANAATSKRSAKLTKSMFPAIMSFVCRKVKEQWYSVRIKVAGNVKLYTCTRIRYKNR